MDLIKDQARKDLRQPAIDKYQKIEGKARQASVINSSQQMSLPCFFFFVGNENLTHEFKGHCALHQYATRAEIAFRLVSS